jgi:TonB family protein
MIALTLALPAILSHAQQAAPSTGAPVPEDQMFSKKITSPKPINTVEAEFSEEARQKRIGGLCLVSLIVDAEGMPQNIQIVRCTDPSFAENSMKAVAQYRFKPATTQEGKPVPVMQRVEINYRLLGVDVAGTPIRYAFGSPPGVLSLKPGPHGVYAFTKLFAPPTMTNFSDEGYGEAAFRIDGSGVCDIVLTISAKGKPSDPQVIHCEGPELEKLAVQSLLKSQYKAGKVKGKTVPMRATIHLEYGGIRPMS